MKKTLVWTIAFVLSLAGSQTHGQWVPTSGPGGGVIASIAVGTSDMFAGAYSGGVFRSTNNGVGWTSIVNNMSSLMVRSILYDGSTLFVATSDSGIFRSTNSGASWIPVNSGLANRASNTLMRSGTTLYAGLGNYSGNGGYVYRSTNNGDSWSVVNGFVWPTTPVSCIARVDTHLFAGTNGAGVWHAGNGTWQAVNASLGDMYVSALAVSGNTLFAGTPAGVYRSTNLGATWTAANGGLRIYEVKFLVTSGSTIYAGTPALLQSTNDGANWTKIHPNTYSLALRGTTLFAGTTVGISASGDSGATWQEYSTGLATGFVGSMLTLGNRLFVGDGYYPGGSGTYRSTDRGTSWDSVHTGLPGRFITSALANIDTIIFCTDFFEGVYRSTDYGNHWVPSDVGLGLGNRPTAFAVQDTQLFAAKGNKVFVSTNRGASWDLRSNFGLPGEPVSNLVFNGNTLFAAYTGLSDDGIYLSTDGGVNWSAANVGLAPGLSNARWIYSLATNGTALFAGTGAGMFRSTDNGASWQAITTGLPPGPMYSVIAPGSTIFAGNQQGVSLSTDNGTTWARTDTRRMIVSSLVRGGTDLYAGISGGGVWRLSSPGNIPVAFSTSPVNGPGLIQCNAPGQAPAINLNFASLAGSGIIAVSRYISPPAAPGFAGTPPAHFSSYRWVITQSGLSSFTVEVRFRLTGLNLGILNPANVTVYRRATPGSGSFSPLPTTYDAASNELRATVTSFSEFIFGSNTDPLTGVQEQEMKPADFMLEQNYPNPFNPTTSIRYSVDGGKNKESGAGHVKLVVYDLLGREVAVLVNEEKPAGSYTLVWNAVGMPSGVYFYQLRARDRVDTRRMILVR